jgi:GTP cyclohydrolase I
MTERAADPDGRIETSHLQVDPEDEVLWEVVRPRSVTLEQWDRFQRSVAEIFEAFGMDLETPGTSRTPERFLKALLDSTAGYEGDPKLLTAFPTECRGGPDCRISQIIEGPISFFALLPNTTRCRSTVGRTSGM